MTHCVTKMSVIVDSVVTELLTKSVNTFSKFGMETMANYQDLFLKCDNLVLGDVLEKFRNRCLENCDLCPSHYLGEPAFSWDAMLSITKVELDLTLDVDMLLCFEEKYKS